MSGPLVDVRNLGKVYEPSPLWMRMLLRSAVDKPVVALQDVSFQVGAGGIDAVVGPNVAGKSTLFRVLTGLTTPPTGSASVMGADTTKKSSLIRRMVGFVPADDRSLYLRHTARDNLIFHSQLQGLPRRTIRRRVDEMLELVGLGHAGDRVGFALSAGMRARLQLARALVHEPSVLILDEPTGAVDPVGSYELLQLIEKVTAERQLAVLISSHRLEEIEALHDHVLLLDRGSLVYDGDLDELRRLWERPRLTIRFASDEAASAAGRRLAEQHGVEDVVTDPPSVTVTTALRVGTLMGLLDGHVADIESVEETKVSLRSVLAQVAESRMGVPSEPSAHVEPPRVP